MNVKEAWQLLTLASARDGRTVDREVAVVWASDLEYVSLRDAVEATQAHYRESTDWLMPAHVMRGVAKIRETRARLERLSRPAIENRVTLDRAALDAQTAWFTANPGKTADDYMKALEVS